MSPEIERARIGKLTASRMSHALDFTAKGAEGAKRLRLKHELLSERMTQKPFRHPVNAYMQWGTAKEPEAKIAYELASGRMISDCGFFDHPTIKDFGATPDGLIDDGVIEFKCPQTTTHIGWILSGGVPEQHKAQILVQLACTGRRHAVFVSFDPEIIYPSKRLHIAHWTPEREEIEAAEEQARKFLAELDEMFNQLMEQA